MMIIDPFEGHFDNLVRRQMEAPIPKTLCRVVKKQPTFDRDGYLRSHRGWNPYGRTVPLAHPNDWETMARYLFQSTRDHFGVLTIDSTKCPEPEREPHPLLVLGEFFTEVHQNTITGMGIYYWDEDPSQKRLPHISPVDRMGFEGVLKQSYGHVPRRVI